MTTNTALIPISRLMLHTDKIISQVDAESSELQSLSRLLPILLVSKQLIKKLLVCFAHIIIFTGDMRSLDNICAVSGG
ncbi:unnamed protein product [Arctia plantaginis]|uniref:Uncharacterized protein n=1 Tax=Arctia plantaginis TaxID=874455 RepID=A0A8S0YYN4_ARCPL|nr:unnamed protein product [Arctia plantaginis]